MRKRLVVLRGKLKRSLRQRAKKATDANYRQRCLIVLKLGEKHTTGRVSRELNVARATASRVGKRFREEGLSGLVDHRIYNGQSKVLPKHLDYLENLLDTCPQDHGWQRPTWTCELFALQLKTGAGLDLSCSHIGRLLRSMGAKWKRARPVVVCPWPRRKRLLHLAALRRLITNLPAKEVAFYVDEMDLHLNPKIGPDWMRKGVQKRIVTPGNNKKAFIAGGLNTRTGELVWEYADRKNSDLFIEFVQQLSRSHRAYKRIHLIADNYSIHSSKKTKQALDDLKGHVVIHFLPPYCSDDNPIEHVWAQLHANVTRNHKCASLGELMCEVDDGMQTLSPFPGSKASTRRARTSLWAGVTES